MLYLVRKHVTGLLFINDRKKVIVTIKKKIDGKEKIIESEKLVDYKVKLKPSDYNIPMEYKDDEYVLKNHPAIMSKTKFVPKPKKKEEKK